MSFKAVLVEQGEKGVSAAVREVGEDQLPEGDVTIAVDYSTLNYKDGLVLQGLGGLVKRYPHVPGVDFSGTVESVRSGKFKPGDKVILNGWRVGEVQWGGYAQKARVKPDWLVRLPDGLTSKEAMAIGTAGYTAMLAVMALEQHGIGPDSGEILVTGAAGGVGSVAVALLAALGHKVAASTGRPETHDYLRGLGAGTIIDRKELSEAPKRLLASERFAGGIDTVGSTTLANLLTQIKYRGSVAACGLAAGNDLPTTVIPFIIRGVNLLGIDSVMAPLPLRVEAWRRLASVLPKAKLAAMTETVPLAGVIEAGKRILKGEVRGRLVVDVNA
jgi:acrylyl-CoA reductase (NADPH)